VTRDLGDMDVILNGKKVDNESFGKSERGAHEPGRSLSNNRREGNGPLHRRINMKKKRNILRTGETQNKEGRKLGQPEL